MSQISLDARLILTHLNDLGYRNITAEQLKEFMKDLRKLIKYEERLGVQTDNLQTIDEKSKNLYDKLHKTTTASYRAKLPQSNIPAKNISSNDKTLCHKGKENVPSKTVTTYKQSKECRKSDGIENPKKSNVDKNVNTDGQNIDSCRSSKVITPSTERATSSKMWIRPKSVASQKTTAKSKNPKNCGPVQLYQYYKSEWEKFKPYLPGENSHADLRWEIRNKLLGEKS